MLYSPIDGKGCGITVAPMGKARFSMHKIVIIDDSEINRTLLQALVTRLGDCRPLSFERPLEALAWCRGETPDLVIVDYMMPEMDGLQFISAFRALHGRDLVPLLMITASDQKDVRYQALESGANDFLTKPIDRIEFAARVRNMLALRQAQKYLADRALHFARLVDEQTAVIVAREQELVCRLSRAAEFRDPETGAHIQRMAHFSRLIAERLGLAAGDRQLLFDAAPMHDVGKIGIPDYILLKPGRLTPQEFELMKQHAQHGFVLLDGSGSQVLQTGAEIALTHHEKFDGSGYPRQLAGEDIPLFGRIVAVADVFDALTSDRPYKRIWTSDDARTHLIDGAGSHFDPACVQAFLAAWDEVLAVQARFRDVNNERLPG